MARGEKWILVDERDRLLGPISLTRCLHLGLRHRAITVLLFNARNELYLQLRSARKQWYPRTWTASVTGHVRFGETYRQAALRELAEELDLSCALRRLGKQRTPAWPYGKVIECEFITVFEGRWQAPIWPSSDEVETGRFVPVPKLMQELVHGARNFTPDLILALELLRLVLQARGERHGHGDATGASGLASN